MERLSSVAPAQAPPWIRERLVVAVDKFEDEDEHRYFLIDCGEYVGAFVEKFAEREVSKLIGDLKQARAILGYARVWDCACYAYRDRRKEMLGERWNLSEFLPPEEYRKLALRWGWVDLGVRFK